MPLEDMACGLDWVETKDSARVLGRYQTTVCILSAESKPWKVSLQSFDR
jgi:hypothetical protein